MTRQSGNKAEARPAVPPWRAVVLIRYTRTHMRKLILGVLLLAMCGLAFAADCPAAGSWKVTAVTPSGEEMVWNLVIKDTDGKLSGQLSGDPGEFPLSDVTFAESVLKAKLDVDTTYTIELKVDGDKLEGKWKNAEGASGPIKGQKQA